MSKRFKISLYKALAFGALLGGWDYFAEGEVDLLKQLVSALFFFLLLYFWEHRKEGKQDAELTE